MSSSSANEPILGIIGGSGLATFPELNVIEKVLPKTIYGLPSDEITVAEHSGKLVFFLPRHGSQHHLPPHKVPYKANLAALKNLGVTNIIGTCIVGSLKNEIPPGSIVIPDQFLNLTWGRDDYFDIDGVLIHLPMGEPYCEHTRSILLSQAQSTQIKVLPKATVIVIQGPRFNTVAESRWQSSIGGDIVNMTQYPEVYFARELGLCYATIASVTDYDVGLKQELSMSSANMDEILSIFRSNNEKVKSMLLDLIVAPRDTYSCGCAKNVIKAYYQQ